MNGEHPGPRRRTVISGTVAALLGVTACSPPGGAHHASGTARPRTPGPDEVAAARAALAARSLATALTSLAAASPALAALATALVADHRAHLSALGVAAPASSAPTAGSAVTTGPTTSPAGTGSPSGSPAASASPTPAPTTAPAPAPAALVAAERTAAGQALDDVTITSAATAGLLARIAAARAVHADLLAVAARLPAPGDLPMASPSPSPTRSPTPAPVSATSPTPTPTPTMPGPTTPGPTASSVVPLEGTAAAALSDLLAGEHAAVFAYGLITARVPDARAGTARALWDAHRARRDDLEERLVAAGLTPPEARPAYDVGPAPTTPAAVAELATRVEEGLAAVALGAVTTTTGPARREAADDLVRAARRAATWRGTTVALPG